MIKIPRELLSAPHALFAPSSAYRWLECPASIARSIGVTPPETTWQAEEGTAAHWVLEQCLLTGKQPQAYLNRTAPNGYPIDSEMTCHVADTLTWLSHFDAPIFPESKSPVYKFLNLPIPDPIIYGTVDLQIWGSDTFTLADFKYGKWNVPVHNNPQLELYAIGLLDIIEVYDQIQFVIIQPRCSSGSKIKQVTYPTEQVYQWRRKYERAIRKALFPDPPVAPTYHNCMFCPASLVCPDNEKTKASNDALEELLNWT